jgi:hypothetical protein
MASRRSASVSTCSRTLQDKETKKAKTTIDNHFFEEKKQARRQHVKKPRLGREVVDEHYEYFASPPGQQDQGTSDYVHVCNSEVILKR